ncbi:uncharacterized protein LOC121683964 isoform X3 [Alosa sapidissima]|uniref:uncharacterized protein LOC121683964 isoform X3 n=1 Tax=Alosa sapidissima TaxID=34773 RepID=UPI001C09222F|nr:uncharacterized protein LOC121683964 isoform X3 [Alosa sapidissima]
MRASTKGSAGSRDDESVPQARKHSRMVRVPGSPVCQQMSLPPPPAYESTPHRQPAHCPELDGSIITPATSSWDPVEAIRTTITAWHSEWMHLRRRWMSCSCS